MTRRELESAIREVTADLADRFKPAPGSTYRDDQEATPAQLRLVAKRLRQLAAQLERD